MKENNMTAGLVGKTSGKIKNMTLAAMFIALTMVFTAFINIQFPATLGGLIHLGNIPMLVAAMLFGRKLGAISGGVGMAMFDVMSGWGAYAPCTLIVVGFMGYVVGAINEKSNKVYVKIFSIIVALVIKVVGYYLFEALIICHSFIVPLGSIPGNITQVAIAGVIVMMIIKPLKSRFNSL